MPASTHKRPDPTPQEVAGWNKQRIREYFQWEHRVSAKGRRTLARHATDWGRPLLARLLAPYGFETKVGLIARYPKKGPPVRLLADLSGNRALPDDLWAEVAGWLLRSSWKVVGEPMRAAWQKPLLVSQRALSPEIIKLVLEKYARSHAREYTVGSGLLMAPKFYEHAQTQKWLSESAQVFPGMLGLVAEANNRWPTYVKDNLINTAGKGMGAFLWLDGVLKFLPKEKWQELLASEWLVLLALAGGGEIPVGPQAIRLIDEFIWRNLDEKTLQNLGQDGQAKLLAGAQNKEQRLKVLALLASPRAAKAKRLDNLRQKPKSRLQRPGLKKSGSKSRVA